MNTQPDMVASFYNPNALEVEAGRTVTGSRLSSATQEVQDLGLPETYLQNKSKQTHLDRPLYYGFHEYFYCVFQYTEPCAS